MSGLLEKAAAVVEEVGHILADPDPPKSAATPAKSYNVGSHEFLYPALGDPKPYLGQKVHVLNQGGVCIEVQWQDGVWDCWSPLPRRNKEKEARIAEKKGLPHAEDGSRSGNPDSKNLRS